MPNVGIPAVTGELRTPALSESLKTENKEHRVFGAAKMAAFIICNC
jgi:hypothetical protein